MTFLEKALLNGDTGYDSVEELMDEMCPYEYGLEDKPIPFVSCSFDNCHDCWHREYIERGKTMIKDSGDRTKFETGAVRDMHAGKGRMDLLPWHAIMEVSKHCENGAVKYGEHNVDKGIPVHSLLDSGMRHSAKFITRQEDEPHLVAACWNLLWALEMMLTKPEMDDRYKENKDVE